MLPSMFWNGGAQWGIEPLQSEWMLLSILRFFLSAWAASTKLGIDWPAYCENRRLWNGQACWMRSVAMLR